jgi:hypothetical protein
MAARKHLGSIRIRACGVRCAREQHVAATRLTVLAEQSFPPGRRKPEQHFLTQSQPSFTPDCLLFHSSGSLAKSLLAEAC